MVENFYYYYDYPRYCTHCGGKGRFSCNNCENCGYCITPDGYGECVSGDANGPYFREDCIAYEHSANGYRIYKHSPYRYLVGLPYWRRDAYYHDLRGYPRTRYVRRRGDQYRRRRAKSAARRARARARSRDVVVPAGRPRSRSRSRSRRRVHSPTAFRVGRVSGPRGTVVGGRSARVGSRGGAGRMGGSGSRGGRGGGRR